MATISSGDIMSAIWDTLYQGQQCMLTTHWKFQIVSGTDPEMFAALAATKSQFETLGDITGQLTDIYNEEVTNITMRMQIIHPVRYVAYVAAAVPSAGQQVGTPTPPNQAVAITLKGVLAGARYRGTKHIHGLVTENFIGGAIDGAYLATLQNLGNALVDDTDNITVGGSTFKWIPIIYHRTAPAISETAVTASVNRYSRVERRRTVQLGS